MTQNEFNDYLETLPCIEKQLVYLRQKHRPQDNWEYLNEILTVDMNVPRYYIWEHDWNEGQEFVEILGCIPISEIDVPLFGTDKKSESDSRPKKCPLIGKMQNKTPVPEYHAEEPALYCGCDINYKNPYKDDCYFYHEEHQMGAAIKCCSLHGGLGNCPCENCDKYLSKSDAFKIVMEYLKR